MNIDYVAENKRKEDNKKNAAKISEPLLQQFAKQQGFDIKSVEYTNIDYDGVDYMLSTQKVSNIPCSFRLIKGTNRMFYLRHSGALGGFSEAQKILNDSTKAIAYITLEYQTKTIRIYSIKDIKTLLNNSNKKLNTGTDGSKYYSIHFNELEPVFSCQIK